ncbi:MAG: hypothetical protein EHM35_03785 [Planctomycetaceae bacterium]|nr:MAG: hypothetical protein EHM35_03785 [Planctomycetaceae bacterium]
MSARFNNGIGPLPHQEIARLHIKGLSIAQIAAQLGRTPGSIGGAVFRLKAKGIIPRSLSPCDERHNRHPEKPTLPKLKFMEDA